MVMRVLSEKIALATVRIEHDQQQIRGLQQRVNGAEA